MTENRSFKGIWIPKEIWLDKELSVMEKLFLVEIDSLDNDDGCFASNGHFSDFFGITKSRCTQIIKGLEKKNLITIEYERKGKQITKRIIRVVNKLNRGIKNIKLGYLENAKGSNTSNSNTNNNSPADAERIPYKKIINYLNTETDRQFSHIAESNRKLIRARWNELKSARKDVTTEELLNSFKRVIDNKVADAKDPNHFFTQEYLRPSTLFRGSNFDNYLNQPPRNKDTKQPKQNDVDWNELERLTGG